MKTNQISRYATALALASIAVLVTACGSGSGSSSPVGIGGIAGGGGVSTPGACVIPLSQSLIFGAQGAQVNATQIYAAPNTGGGMTTTLQVGGFSNGYQYSNTWNTAASDAYVGMNIQATGVGVGYPTTGYPTTGGYGYTVQGALQLTQLRWQTIVLELEQKYPYGYTGTQYGYGTSQVPYGQAPSYAAGGIPANICVSGIAFDVIYGPGTLQGGTVVLYLNTNDQISLVL